MEVFPKDSMHDVSRVGTVRVRIGSNAQNATNPCAVAKDQKVNSGAVADIPIAAVPASSKSERPPTADAGRFDGIDLSDGIDGIDCGHC
jgi:hypothetical protein